MYMVYGLYLGLHQIMLQLLNVSTITWLIMNVLDYIKSTL